MNPPGWSPRFVQYIVTKCATCGTVGTKAQAPEGRRPSCYGPGATCGSCDFCKSGRYRYVGQRLTQFPIPFVLIYPPLAFEDMSKKLNGPSARLLITFWSKFLPPPHPMLALLARLVTSNSRHVTYFQKPHAGRWCLGTHSHSWLCCLVY
jgi:hypothetical protein